MRKDSITYEIVTEFPPDDIVALYEEGGWWEESEKHRKDIPKIIKGSFCFMVAIHQNKTIGMGRVISDGVSDAYIQDVIVLKEYRGLKVGTEIVKRLTQFCLEHSLGWIGLIAAPKAVGFYTNLGFQPLKNFQALLYQQEPMS